MKKVCLFILNLIIMTALLLPVSSGAATIAIGGANIADLENMYKTCDVFEDALKSETEALKSSNKKQESYSPEVEEYVEKNYIVKENDSDLKGKILQGIMIDDIDVSDMTYSEACDKVNEYLNEVALKNIILESVEGKSSTYRACDLGMSVGNSDVVKDAFLYGKSGNIISQYKNISDLKHTKKVFNIEPSFDREKVIDAVTLQGTLFNVEAVNATISRKSGQFEITDGQTGLEVNVNASVNEVMNKLASWSKENETISLKVDISQPEGTKETLAKVTDLLGTYTTSFSSSGPDRSGNVRNGCKHINGTILMPGEQFSAYGTVSPFTEENGYFMAGSYLNGMVVDSLGGGICQVSSTLYNAVLRAELQVDERSPHSLIVTYVDLSSDAAIAGTYKDFKFTNSTDSPIYIEGYTTDDKKITFNVFGHETRPSNRKITFESVETSKTEPDTENIIADPSQPVGFISTQSAHIGYTGELWKIVTVDGKETDRVKVNRSTYNPSPRTATVGIKADNPEFTQAMQNAIASGSIDTCKQTIAQLKAAAAGAPAPAQTPEPAQEQHESEPAGEAQ